MGGLALRIKLWWDSADRTQRAVTVGGGAFLAILVAATFIFATRPKMALLFGGLSPTEQGSVVTELEKIGITPDFNERGDVLVASDRVADARVRLAAAGKLPQTTGFGDEQLAKLGIMETPAVEKERLKTILEGRLAESIESIDGVGSARVNLVLGEDSPFVRDNKPATASVTIAERGSAELSKDQGKAIATLVANSVPGLSLTNVAVLNNRMEMLYDGSDAKSVEGQVDEKLDTEKAESSRREEDLQAMLDRVFGPSSTIVKVNVEMDFDDRSVVTDQTDPVKLNRSEVTETMDGAKGVGGAATIAPNAPASGAGSTYSMTNKQNDFVTNTTHTESRPAAGTLKSMAIDVIANSDKVADPKQVGAIIDGYLGSHKGETGFSSLVTMVKFDTSASKAAVASASTAATAARMQQILSMLPIAALIGVAIMVMRQLGKVSRVGSVTIGGGQLAFEGRGYPGGHAPLRFEAGGSEEASQQIAQAILAAGETDDEAEAQLASIKGISRKVNVPLEQIRKMSSDRPEVVAVLIKGWLLEER